MHALHVDNTLREYTMQGNRLVARGLIRYSWKPTMGVLDAEREALFVGDWCNPGLVAMLRNGGAGIWEVRKLLDDRQMHIQSMCLLDANKLSLFDANYSALRIYEFA